MQHLPTAEEQEWLLDALAGLIAQHGSAPFLAAPILLPTRTYFPEARGTAAFILDRTTRRLLQYAGMGDLDISLAPFVEVSDTEDVDPHRDTTAAFFAGIQENCCLFGLNALGSADADYLAGVMCHEVAHAFRARHGLVTDSDDEELRTDLTTIYLGFGILSANVSWRFRKSGEVSGGLVMTQWSASRGGYLPPQALTFLLAAQMTVRGTRPERRREILRALEPNQAGFLDKALTALAPESERLVRRLRLPFRQRWPAERAPEAILLPLPDFVPWEEQAGAEQALAPDATRPVFRLQRNESGRYGVLGVLLAGIALVIAFSMNLLLPGLVFACLTFGLMAYLGWRQRFDVCSDSDCGTRLAAGAQACPHCGASIVGTVRNTAEILVAEEKLQAEGKWPAQYHIDPEHDPE